MKRFLIFAMIVLPVLPSFAMTGGPIFAVGQGMTSMTVEASKVNWQIASTGSNGDESVVSNRLGLTARYGLTPNMDFGATLGAATMGFNDLPSGYSNSTESWSFAWGASIRAGLPAEIHRFQVLAIVNYMGFQPEATTTKATKTIESKYLWHEITPTVTLGMRFGNVIPYIGACKPILMGRRDVKVSLSGVPMTNLSTVENYTDGEQLIRPLAGVEWRLPDGYSIGLEADGNSEGYWTVSVGLAQVLK